MYGISGTGERICSWFGLVRQPRPSFGIQLLVPKFAASARASPWQMDLEM